MLEKIDPSWLPLFSAQKLKIESILESVKNEDISPAGDRIFRAFEEPLDKVSAVIFGQDPYPGVGVADGLAFSTYEGNPIPASLRNIFKEYSSDLGYEIPKSPDLSKWSKSGVLLLNRTLTTSVGQRNAHVASGWKEFTSEIARALAKRDVVAILWGNYARELAPLFKNRIESAHPSPLSARRGFFGSKPFSRTNEMLRDLEREEVNWKL
jgi:uracil-DNA glycosylase